jgi:hypothetical protein
MQDLWCCFNSHFHQKNLKGEHVRMSQKVLVEKNGRVIVEKPSLFKQRRTKKSMDFEQHGFGVAMHHELGVWLKS